MTIPTHTLDVTLLECMWMLRWLRALRDRKKEELLLIEEQIRAGHDGSLVAGHRAIDADIAIADEIIRKIWMTCGPTSPKAKP
jgi:hypothetical protein